MWYVNLMTNNCDEIVQLYVTSDSDQHVWFWTLQGVGSAVNKLNDVVAMIAEVRSIANSLVLLVGRHTTTTSKEQTIRL